MDVVTFLLLLLHVYHENPDQAQHAAAEGPQHMKDMKWLLPAHRRLHRCPLLAHNVDYTDHQSILK